MADTVAEQSVASAPRGDSNFFSISNEALIEKYLSEPFFLYLTEKIGLLGDLNQARTRIAECIKLLLLITFSKGNAPISRELDDVWHFMILETEQYALLCQKLPTQKFIHHRSIVFEKYSSQNTKKDFAQDLKEKLSWFVSYRRNFGPFSEETIQYWPIGLEIMKDKKISIEQFNQLLNG